jgi:cell division protease FtsH
MSQQFGLDARVSPETATLVDIETRRVLEEAVVEASSILKSHRLALDNLADLLCEHETVDGTQIDVILDQEKKQEEEERLFSEPAPNGQKPFQVGEWIKVEGWPKGKA